MEGDFFPVSKKALSSRYQIQEKIGRGGMGEVYLAKDTVLERPVALKFLHEEMEKDEQAKSRLLREARAAAALDHPYICKVYDTGEIDGRTFIAMEYVDGVSLKERLSKGTLSVQEALQIASEVAEALEMAAQKGIVHRDIKPSNIMISKQGHVKVTDFGLAKRTPTIPGKWDDSTATLSGDLSPRGTLPYMSPEQLKTGEVDQRSDIFALGVVLYEALTGVSPFYRSARLETAEAVLHTDPAPLQHYLVDVPDLLQHTVRKMLAKEKDLRYQSVHEVFTDLAEVLKVSGERKGPKTPDKRRRWVTLTAVGGAALILIAILWVYRMAPASQMEAPAQRSLIQFTFGERLEMEPSWSPDGSLIAYASDRGGNLDIWVQAEEGKPVQVTEHPAHDWQPDWSPDGKLIVFRSERNDGGLFVIPASGGVPRRIASFGYEPQWSPDGSKILFYSTLRLDQAVPPRLFLVRLDGAPPIEVLSEFTSTSLSNLAAAWHPDGKRISIRGRRQEGWGFWTYPVPGGQPLRSDVALEVRQRWQAAALRLYDFIWAPSGDALFFEGESRSVRNLWKVNVEPESLRWRRGPERLTASPIQESDFDLSSDGGKLAYSARNERVRIWLFPFDAEKGQVGSEGRVVSPEGLETDNLVLARDGTKVAFLTLQAAGESRQLRTKWLDTGREIVASTGNYGFLCWSRDGLRLACRKSTPIGTQLSSSLAYQAILIPPEGGPEEVLNSPVINGANNPSDWSLDGQWILLNCRRGVHTPDASGAGRQETQGERPSAHICVQPLSSAPRAEEKARVVASHPDYDLWQARFSPDDRWISFNAVDRAGARSSTLYLVPAAGGEWIPVTDGKFWADKPRWAPDGRTLYYISSRGGFYNLWGIRIEPTTGKPLGDPFQLTHFDSPNRSIDPLIVRMEMGISRDRLALSLMEVTGNIWVLSNVDQ